MKLTRLAVFIFAMLLLGGIAARADDVLTVDAVPGQGPKVKLALPPGWVGKLFPGANPGSDMQAVKMKTPAEGQPATEMVLTFLYDGKGELKDHGDIAKLMEATMMMYSEGRKVLKVTLESKSVWGLYSVFMASDSVLPQQPGAPKCTVAGLLRTKEGYMINFVILNDDPKGEPCQQALKFLLEGIATEAAK